MATKKLRDVKEQPIPEAGVDIEGNKVPLSSGTALDPLNPVSDFKQITNEQGQVTGIERKGKVYMYNQPATQRNNIQLSNNGTTTSTGQQVFLSKQALQVLEKYKTSGAISPEDLATLSPSEIDYVQAVLTGSSSAVIGAAGTALTGAAGGALVGGPAGGLVGAVGGAVLGAVSGAVLGIKSDIKSQLAGNIGKSGPALEKGESNLRTIITNINAGGNPVEGVNLFYQQLAAIDLAHQQLKLDTQRSLSKFTGEDGTAELGKYVVFNNQTRAMLERELAQAIANPNPNKILVTPEELTQ